MLKLKQSFLLSILVFSIFTSIYSQKPTPKNPNELILEQEDPYYYADDMRISSRTGFPLALYNQKIPVEGSSPEMKARNYLQTQKVVFGLSDLDLQNLKLKAVREGIAATTVRFSQTEEGYPVKGGEITVSINPKDQVCFVMNAFKYHVDLALTNPKISSSEARRSLMEYIDLTKDIIEEHHFTEVFQHNNSTYLSHRIIIASLNPLGEWEAIVNAEDGEILQFKDISCFHKDETSPPLVPLKLSILVEDGSGNVFDPDPLSSSLSEYGDTGFSDDGDNNSDQLTAELKSVVLPNLTFQGGEYFLISEYAEIQDFETPNRGLFGQASNTFNFNRKQNGFEAVNTFYHVDASMRYINEDLGLDIMPFNYSGGVRFDPHGLGGADNSHYLGGSQRIAFGEGGVDDAEDSDVIHHELGHGLHDWVTNGGLSQVNGLSEGSGDYWAASYNRSLGYWDESDPANNWVFIWDGHNPFWNGRVVNYPETYPDGLSGGIHKDGQIWATCMINIWDEIGQIKTDKAFWEGLGMTNGGSNQNDAANAVYTAAENMNYEYLEMVDIYQEMTATGYIVPNPTILPIALLSFKAQKEKEEVKLDWVVGSHGEIESFAIERSNNNRDFTSLEKISPLGEELGSPVSYDYHDKQPLQGQNYYRLKMIEQDGKVSYSRIGAIYFESNNIIEVFPNPVDNVLSIKLKNGYAYSNVRVLDGMGAVRIEGLSLNKNGKYQIDVSNLESGLYYLQFEGLDRMEVHKFMKR